MQSDNASLVMVEAFLYLREAISSFLAKLEMVNTVRGMVRRRIKKGPE